MKKPTQRDVMRDLVARFGEDEETIITEYAQAERNGEVNRGSNTYGLSAEGYARALWNDGVRKGWLTVTMLPAPVEEIWQDCEH